MNKKPTIGTLSCLLSFAVVGVVAFGAGMYTDQRIHPVEETKASQEGGSVAFPLPTAIPTPYPLTRDNVQMLVNEARLKANLPQLGDSENLDKQAQYVADQIASNDNCSHDYIRSLRDKGSKLANITSETLACGILTANQAVEGFLSSPTHRDVLLGKDYTAFGIGISGPNVVIHFVK